MTNTKERFGQDGIVVKGAKEHNLKDVSVTIPRNKITVFTGLSGSGKSSLAFDTIYAEGQRRYVESLSAYARNFLEQLKKPEVDSITGLSPAIAIDQKSVSTNPRSTVGTVTEIYDYLRLLYAKLGVPECPTHHIPVASQTPQQIIEDVLKKSAGAKFYVLAPMASGKKGEFLAEFQKWAKKGFVKAKVDGKIIELDKATKLAKTKAHDIDLVVDQLILKDGLKLRLSESINTALSLAGGRVIIETLTGERTNYSMHSACPVCGYGFPEIEPRLFSFNNPRGACPTCHGLGTIDLVEEEQFSDGEVGGKKLDKVVYKYKGKKTSDDDDEEGEEMELSDCPDCHGSRLKPEALNIKLGGRTIAELSDLSAVELREWMAQLQWKTKDQLIAEKIVKQILSRLDYLIRVGTSYLSLSRTSRTLSGGEAQRIRLATQVGSSLIGVLYVMDEPSIGLHPRDHHRLLDIIGELKDRGNTILLVEHDEDTIRYADFVVDLGPRAGSLGGEMMAQGTPEELEKNPKSLTGRYLSGEVRIPIPKVRRKGNGSVLRLLGATGNNLQNVDLEIPLGTFTTVTGVSGSGKSTLIIDTLYKILAQHFYKASAKASPYKKIEGLDKIDKVIDINQRPIGRTPRSTPATYVGLFPMIRDLFANLPDSKLRGYEPGRFSFNVKGGRCETCLGHGQIKVEMHFLSDVFVTCDTCLGKRYNRETLNIKYKNKSISDVLDMNVAEALEFFRNHSQIFRKLETLHRVGLDYMTLGQSSTTLSGGEAQRVKLSKELSRRGTGKTLYILDEPTTGLHFDDVRKLVELMQELADQGNTVLVIEHALEVIKVSDHVIDLGPDGGKAGGRIVAAGTPEQVAKVKDSETGKFLKGILK
ncbi:excinuclease ABC subunit UvrA [Bdellovibrio svalbardensis]|uniref:UvrABC system protein A n=1 Tax=Bdellovibrio svalbardensis TaxID=2972972 RepID=A0ABT6DH08_9BACT|nr:excinuclease ABC subunit UvrA [Bdellovibrio svalbardensis]MDG0816134.1 excinuclease ABC subunit UvrA [Bdellovibrio svalbardensis]